MENNTTPRQEYVNHLRSYLLDQGYDPKQVGSALANFESELDEIVFAMEDSLQQ